MSAWETTGQSDEWHTPKHVFDSFDMDVAAPLTGGPHVPAGTWIFADSLSAEWVGFVWMNPPFGKRNGLEPWLDKFFDHNNGIALTPDRTSAPWFRKAWARTNAVLFMPKIRFLRPDGSEGKSPSTGSCLWASGERAIKHLRIAARSGAGILAYPG